MPVMVAVLGVMPLPRVGDPDVKLIAPAVILLPPDAVMEPLFCMLQLGAFSREPLSNRMDDFDIRHGGDEDDPATACLVCNILNSPIMPPKNEFILWVMVTRAY